MELRILRQCLISGLWVDIDAWGGIAAEVEAIRVEVASDLVVGITYIDPAKLPQLIYNVRHYFELADDEPGKNFRAEK